MPDRTLRDRCSIPVREALATHLATRLVREKPTTYDFGGGRSNSEKCEFKIKYLIDFRGLPLPRAIGPHLRAFPPPQLPPRWRTWTPAQQPLSSSPLSASACSRRRLERPARSSSRSAEAPRGGRAARVISCKLHGRSMHGYLLGPSARHASSLAILSSGIHP